MFEHIKPQELPILAKSFKGALTTEEGHQYPERSNEEVLADLELVDHLLAIMKSKSLLNRKRGLLKMVDGLLAISVGDASVVPGHSNNHLLG